MAVMMRHGTIFPFEKGPSGFSVGPDWPVRRGAVLPLVPFRIHFCFPLLFFQPHCSACRAERISRGIGETCLSPGLPGRVCSPPVASDRAGEPQAGDARVWAEGPQCRSFSSPLYEPRILIYTPRENFGAVLFFLEPTAVGSESTGF